MPATVDKPTVTYADTSTLRQKWERIRAKDDDLGQEAGTALHQPADPTLQLSIVVPFFRTGRQQLAETLTGLRDQLHDSEVAFEVIAVDDGGHDDTFHAVDDVNDPRVRLLQLAENQGKGGALLHGFGSARAEWIGFIDADGDISPDHLRHYLQTAMASDSDMVVADKTHVESLNDVESSRAATSKVMHLVNGKLLQLTMTDTQTGAKIFRREFLAQAVPIAKERGFALDVELFVLARMMGYRRILGMPVAIDRQGGSTVSKKAVLKTGLRVLRIWSREKLGQYKVEKRRWNATRVPEETVETPQIPTDDQDRRSGKDRRRKAKPGQARDRRTWSERRSRDRD